MLIMLLILSVTIPQLGAKVVDEDIALVPVTGPHAIVVEALLKKFLAFMKNVVPLLLHDAAASEGAMSDWKV